MQVITLIASLLSSMPFCQCMKTHCLKFCRGNALFNQNIKLLLHCTWRSLLLNLKCITTLKKLDKTKAKDGWDLASIQKILYSHVNTFKVILWYPTNNQVSKEADSQAPVITKFSFYWTEFQNPWTLAVNTVYNLQHYFSLR